MVILWISTDIGHWTRLWTKVILKHFCGIDFLPPPTPISWSLFGQYRSPSNFQDRLCPRCLYSSNVYFSCIERMEIKSYYYYRSCDLNTDLWLVHCHNAVQWLTITVKCSHVFRWLWVALLFFILWSSIIYWVWRLCLRIASICNNCSANSSWLIAGWPALLFSHIHLWNDWKLIIIYFNSFSVHRKNVWWSAHDKKTFLSEKILFIVRKMLWCCVQYNKICQCTRKSQKIQGTSTKIIQKYWKYHCHATKLFSTSPFWSDLSIKIVLWKSLRFSTIHLYFMTYDGTCKMLVLMRLLLLALMMMMRL